ncbi:hypothetical protein VTO73DRAFT_1648 [Trametes versicolor]
MAIAAVRIGAVRTTLEGCPHSLTDTRGPGSTTAHASQVSGDVFPHSGSFHPADFDIDIGTLSNIDVHGIHAPCRGRWNSREYSAQCLRRLLVPGILSP